MIAQSTCNSDSTIRRRCGTKGDPQWNTRAWCLGHTMASKGTKRMTQGTQGARMLRDIFAAGKLTGNGKPAEVRITNSFFHQCDAKSFGEKFRKYKDTLQSGMYYTLYY